MAAGYTPVDLNNLFITSDTAEGLVQRAESEGFPHNLCCWIKGIYSSILQHGVGRIVAVTGGDCSNTVALSEVLGSKGVEVIPFRYPGVPGRSLLREEMEAFRKRLPASWEQIEAVRQRLSPIRTKLIELDELTYKQNLVTGEENHLFLVGSSDFGSDPDAYERKLDCFLAEARERSPVNADVRLGFIGVPPIYCDLYRYIESLGARVVFNEVQRQFSMPYGDPDIVSQYLNYTYPYHVMGRIRDIREAVQTRSLHGLLHYTQTFCFRQIQDILMKEHLDLPILTLEGDRPGAIDGRTATRIETFIEMVRDQVPLRF
ncbi:MAG: 2-hydroxyacyl-CoA dehydratase [Desulfobacteraceae bacterium]|nr:MAG: 2-hydroxyacyl-CoA dehydratase [Desulfobacteraceae bacterium]